MGDEGGRWVHLDRDGGTVGWEGWEGGGGAGRGVWVGEEVEPSQGVVVVEEGYEGCCEGVGGLVFHYVGFGVGFVFVDGWRGWWVVDGVERGIGIGVEVFPV